MRRTYHFLLAIAIVAAPMPVAAQVSVDLNALSGLGGGRASLPEPPPSAPTASHRYRHRRHFLSRAEQARRHGEASALASATPGPAGSAAGPETIEHPTNLGASFTSLPALPGAVPPMPAPPPVLALPAAVAKPPAKLAAPAPVETAAVAPKPASTPKPAPKPASTPKPAPSLTLPAAVPPPALSRPPARLAEATPAPPAAAPPPPPKPAPNALPKGADRLTLPFFVEESDLPPAENAMLRDFAHRYGARAQYTIRAYATPPAGDDDPSTPRRIALERAQSVAAALMDSGVQPDRVRLLALGNAGGAPADRVEVIAIPPSSGHTTSDSSP
jgi:outer membrane protein OmpA-like peptidoglycan-associated protein